MRYISGATTPALVRLVAPGAPQEAGGMVFFTLTAVATLTVWILRRTAPYAAATGGSLAVVPAAALTLSGLHGAGLPAIAAGAATEHYGLRIAAHAYAIAAALLAVAALAALTVSRGRTVHHAHNDFP
ncbi:hypothetical protein [Streptomyces arenae]|uniref:hypothetical protein n=1 Tax=Streptomyces arenae TaxID=29301 RepID=UPI0026590B5E|nr:hypothetical protein [Streptomyces arenae]MCG7208821.1 hypothetical protein [Streptomyces arenae]